MNNKCTCESNVTGPAQACAACLKEWNEDAAFEDADNRLTEKIETETDEPDELDEIKREVRAILDRWIATKKEDQKQ